MLAGRSHADTDEPLILIVDDEEATRHAVRRTLRDEGEIRIAQCATDALRVLGEHAVWVLISDQRMPGTSGCALLAQVVEHHPEVVRIMLTGYADVETVREAVNGGGIYHCLTKPWQTRELQQVVRRGIERYRAARERALLLRDLEVACDRLRAEADRRARLLALTTHELGTPVHILLNALELAMDREELSGSEWLRMAQRASVWLTRVLAQVTTAARLEHHGLSVRRVPVDLGALVHTACARLREALTMRRVTIEVPLDGPSVHVVSDPHWLEHALWGLLTNAVRFTPDGGSICVTITRDEALTRVAVHDTGIGIAAEHLDDVFEPFSSATGNTLAHRSGFLEFGVRGVGLGLATVKRIMGALGGAVAVTSVLGHGSCFRLEIPTTQHTAD